MLKLALDQKTAWATLPLVPTYDLKMTQMAPVALHHPWTRLAVSRPGGCPFSETFQRHCSLTVPSSPHTDKGYQCRDNSIGRPHCKWACEDPQEIPHGLEERSSVKGIGILLGTVNGYRTEKKREWRLVSDFHLSAQAPEVWISHPLLKRIPSLIRLGAGWEFRGNEGGQVEVEKAKSFPFPWHPHIAASQ